MLELVEEVDMDVELDVELWLVEVDCDVEVL